MGKHLRWCPCTSGIFQRQTENIQKKQYGELLSHRKLLHVSFIGHSVMELLVEKKDSVTIATFVRSAGMTQMPNFNVFDNAMRNRRKAEIPTAQAKNMAMVRGRANFCASKADNYVAKEWYKSLAKAAHRRLQHLNKDISTVTEGTS